MNTPHSAKQLKLWLYLVCLGCVLPNYPFVHIFRSVRQIWGIPLFPLFLWGSWLIAIVVIYLFSRKVIFR